MTLGELQAALFERKADLMLVMQNGRYAVTVSEREDAAQARDVRPSERGYGYARGDALDEAVIAVLEAFDRSLKRRV